MKNTTEQTPTKQDRLAKILEQYEENTKPKAEKQTSGIVYNEKNYFSTYLPDKVASAEKTIRILPTEDGSSPFIEIHAHKVKVDGKQQTFICAKHERDEDCPFCEAREALYASGTDSDKELAKKYSARKYYVVKVIDRDDEDFGPKFWRFTHDYSKKGIFDKIHGVIKAIKKDVSDPETGRDLVLILGRDQNNYPMVQTVQGLDPSPLSEDPAKVAAWLGNTATWENVYSVKSYDFLEIIVKGGVPVYDKVAKKYVDKNGAVAPTEALDEELSLGVANVKPNITTATKVTKTPVVALPEEVVAADDEEDEDDDSNDLPF